MIRKVLHIFDWLIFHYFLQLNFRLTPLTSAAESNKKIVNQTLCNTVLILDASLYETIIAPVIPKSKQGSCYQFRFPGNNPVWNPQFLSDHPWELLWLCNTNKGERPFLWKFEMIIGSFGYKWNVYSNLSLVWFD